MDPPSVLAHIGYHKTGTTWLQHNLFTNKGGVFAVLERKARVGDLFAGGNPFAFDVEGVRRHFAAALDDARGRGLCPVISCERLAGTPHSGGYDSRQIADRLFDVFGNCRVVIGIREQHAMILSAYKQYVRVGGTLSLQSYIAPIESGRGRVPRFRREYYEYHWLIEYYQRRFSRDHVLALPQETLAADPTGVCATIAAFAGVDLPSIAWSPERRNVAMGGVTAAVRRRSNRWLGRDALNPGAPWRPKAWNETLDRVVARLVPSSWQTAVDRRSAAIIRRHCEGAYEDSNRVTAEITGLPLADLGYEWPTD